MAASDLVLEHLQSSIKDAIQSRLMNEILPHAQFYTFASPILLLLVGALLIMLLGVFTSHPLKPSKYSWYMAVFVAFIAALIPIISRVSTPIAYLGSGVLADEISLFSFVVISIGTLFTLLAAATTNVGKYLLRAELLSLLLFSSAGLMIMCSAGEFVSFFIGLELTSVSLYVLVGYQRKDLQAIEASVKYFLLGAVAAAVLLMGAALIYASIGSLRFCDFHLLNLYWVYSFLFVALCSSLLLFLFTHGHRTCTREQILILQAIWHL
jgi:NADH-quinone oxidoreductase subunit N